MSRHSQSVSTPESGTETYGQILKASALIGGSSGLNIAIRILRTKAMAVLLGPSGFGLFGIYGSVAALFQSIAGMGMSSSGVRQIAHASGTKDTEFLEITATLLRRISMVLGLGGALLMIVCAPWISRFTFGNKHYVSEIMVLSVAVLFLVISDGQTALIHGLSRIKELASVGVIGGLLGAVFSILLVYLFREEGIVPSIIAAAGATLGVSWWFSRRLTSRTPKMTNAQVRQEASALLTLGVVFMIGYVASKGSTYLIRVILLREVGLAATGYYQSAWTIGGLYVGFILDAMGADFYPRLTANSSDDAFCNRLVNEQTHVGLLLSGPGVMATLTVAPIVITLFYSSRFGEAVGVLRWITAGAILQVMTWPLGYMMLAKGKQTLYLASVLTWNITELFLAWFCIQSFGLNGAGMAFVGTNVIYGIVAFVIARRLSNFRLSEANKEICAIYLSINGLVFVGFYTVPNVWALFLGVLATAACSVYSLRKAAKLVPIEQIPAPLRKVLNIFKLK